MIEKWLLSTTASLWCTFRYINMDKLNTICQIKHTNLLINFKHTKIQQVTAAWTGSIPDNNYYEDEQKMNR